MGGQKLSKIVKNRRTSFMDDPLAEHINLSLWIFKIKPPIESMYVPKYFFLFLVFLLLLP